MAKAVIRRKQHATDDLLERGLVTLNEQGACVEYIREFVARQEAKMLMSNLLKEVCFDSPEQSRVRMFGKWHAIPRQQTAYGDLGTSYTFSGTRVKARPWIPVLGELRETVVEQLAFDANFVLVNHYRDGADCIGWHSDDERDLGPKPTIVSISFGASREFQMRPKKPSEGGRRIITLPLESGSALVMHHPTNDLYQHRIPRRGGARPDRIGSRLNLTWRRMPSQRNYRRAEGG